MSNPAIIFGAAIVGVAIISAPVTGPMVSKFAEAHGLPVSQAPAPVAVTQVAVAQTAAVQNTASAPELTPAQRTAQRNADILAAIQGADPASLPSRVPYEQIMLDNGHLPGRPEKALTYPVFDYLAGTYAVTCAQTGDQVSGQITFTEAETGNRLGLYSSVSVVNKKTQHFLAADRFCQRAQSAGAFEKAAPLPDMSEAMDNAVGLAGLERQMSIVEPEVASQHYLTLPTSDLPPAIEIADLPHFSAMAPGTPTQIKAQFLHSLEGVLDYWNVCSISSGQVTGTLVSALLGQNADQPAGSLVVIDDNDKPQLYLAAQKQCQRIMAGAEG